LGNKIYQLLLKFRAQLYIGWVLFIALITLLPGSSIPNIIDWNMMELDKVIHFSVFAIHAFLGSLVLSTKSRSTKSAALLSISISMIYGGLIETLQTLIPERGFDYADLTANYVGALVGILLFSMSSIRKKL